jgi:hypothetical protein
MKSLLLLACLVAPLAAESFDVQLVQTRVGRPLGDEVPFEVKPMGHEPGVEFSFLIRGADLVAIKDDSVDIATFTLADGRQWARTRSGRANWKQQSFAKVSEDGKLGSFAVTFPGDLHGVVEAATLEGSVTAVVATRSEEKKLQLTAGDKTLHEAGPFEVSGAGAGGFFSGGGQDQTSVTVKGDHQAVIEVIVMDGGKKLDGNGSSWSGDSKTFHFDKAAGEQLDVTLRYWVDLKEVAVPFKVAPAKK